MAMLTQGAGRSGIAGDVDWSPLRGLGIQPSVEIASSRWTLFTATPTTQPRRYYRAAGYVTAALPVDYAIIDKIELSGGARNLFDKEYSLTDGFPKPGRSSSVPRGLPIA